MFSCPWRKKKKRSHHLNCSSKECKLSFKFTIKIENEIQEEGLHFHNTVPLQSLCAQRHCRKYYRAYLVQCFSIAALTHALICLLQREESRHRTDELHCQCLCVCVCVWVCLYCMSFSWMGTAQCAYVSLYLLHLSWHANPSVKVWDWAAVIFRFWFSLSL